MTRLKDAKVGDDVRLSHSLEGDDGSLIPLESAHVTIVRVDRTNKRVVSAQPATIEDSVTARYAWPPLADGEFVVEWHLRHSGGLNKYTDDSFIRVDRRLAGPVSGGLGPSIVVGHVTSSASGVVPISGGQSTVIAGAAPSAAAMVDVRGEQVATIGAVSLEGSASALVVGSQSATVGEVTGSAAAAVLVSGAQAASVGAVSQVAAGAVRIAGAQSATVGQVTPSATGTVVNQYLLDQIVANGDPLPGRAFCDFTLLRGAYAGGPLIRVERVTGGTEQDIGHDANGDLDVAALATFCGASLGRIVTRYDQSGNGRHETQATGSRRPQIWDGSAVRTDGVAGRPAAAYSRASLQSLGRAGYLSGTGAYTICYMGRSSTTGYQTWTMHTPLAYGNIGANPWLYANASTPQRQFTPITAIGTLAGYISTFAASTLSGAIPLEQNGTSLAQAAINGSTTINFATTDARTGNESNVSTAALEGRLPCMIEWGVQLSAASLVAWRDFAADNI